MQKIVRKVVELHDRFLNESSDNFTYTTLLSLNKTHYKDADISSTLPHDLDFNPWVILIKVFNTLDTLKPMDSFGTWQKQKLIHFFLLMQNLIENY